MTPGNEFILRLQRGTGRKATWRTRLAAKLIRLFNARSSGYALKFKRDDFNRYFGIKYSRFDRSENLLQGGMLTVEQAVNLYHLLCHVVLLDVPGDVVEVGCYEGTTAILLQMTLDRLGCPKPLHVYDSFAGLPAKSAKDGETRFAQGDCRTTRAKLIENFERHGVKRPAIHAGWFAETLPAELPDRICFAHVDGDFYTSVRESLEHVYPRLSTGAVVVVDDYCDPAVNPVYDSLPGVKRACDDFLRDKPERMGVLLAGSGAHGYFRKR
jgi:O-methyltransferase